MTIVSLLKGAIKRSNSHLITAEFQECEQSKWLNLEVWLDHCLGKG